MDISTLIEQASPQDRVRLKVYHNAVVKCTQAYQTDPTAAKLRDLKAAEQVRDSTVEEITAGFAQSVEVVDVSDDLFATKLEAWQYLQDSGWQIGRSQFYEHCKEGRLPRTKDGKYQRERVDKYAELHCRRVETGEKVNETRARVADEKADVELLREKVRLKKEEHDLSVRLGEYVRRDEVELMIVGRAVAMLSHLKAMAQMSAPDWIALVEGKQERARELIDAVQIGIEEHLSVFARDIEFEVIFEKNGEEGRQ